MPIEFLELDVIKNGCLFLNLYDCILKGPEYRAVGRSEYQELPLSFGGRHNLPLMVEIGSTDLSKSGGAMAPLAPPETTGLNQELKVKYLSLSGCNIKEQVLETFLGAKYLVLWSSRSLKMRELSFSQF